jgi:hypothetical protein
MKEDEMDELSKNLCILLRRVQGIIRLLAADVVPAFTEAMEVQELEQDIDAIRFWRGTAYEGILETVRIMYREILAMRQSGEEPRFRAFLREVADALDPEYVLGDDPYVLNLSEPITPLTFEDGVPAVTQVRYMAFSLHGLVLASLPA